MAALPDLTVVASGRRYRVKLDVLRAEIHRLNVDLGESLVAIAARCGVERTTLYRLLRGPVSLATACKIAAALGIDQKAVVFEVPEDYSSPNRLLASEEVLEQVEQSDPPQSRFWMMGELTPYNRKLAPVLLAISLLLTLLDLGWGWWMGGTADGTFLFACLAVILLAFFTIRIRWTLWAVGAIVACRLLLFGAGRLPLETLLVESAFVVVYCGIIRLMGMFSRHMITREAKASAWAAEGRGTRLQEEGKALEWLNFRSGSS